MPELDCFWKYAQYLAQCYYSMGKIYGYSTVSFHESRQKEFTNKMLVKCLESRRNPHGACVIFGVLEEEHSMCVKWGWQHWDLREYQDT